MTTREFQALRVISANPNGPSKMIRHSLGVGAETARKTVHALLVDGYIQKVNQKKYRLTNLGRQVLDGMGVNLDRTA